MRTLHFVSRTPAVLLVGAVVALAGCERTKSATPLSPSLAGPIDGVTISQPTLMQPAVNRQLRDTEQPVALTFGQAQSSGVRPLRPRSA